MFGGKQMRPWMVGLSLFATLFSAISYLSWPGEVIKYGPMMTSGLIAYPLIYFVIGWFLIPRIMRLNLTSAYELLEIKLCLGVRMLACVFFLSMRIIWMSVILYMSAEKVMVPVMKWPSEYVIWVSITLGVITVIYTSLGGLRAVVMTDTIQSIILFGGAVFVLVSIIVKMGGVTACWPSQWVEGWTEFKFGYDPKARVTIIGAFIMWFSWYICTAGSDQMAIQRYISTKNVKSARRAQLVCLLGDTCVMAFLGVVGIALFAYFTKYKDMVPQGWTFADHSDKLFPHFIVIGLPTGITGLVIAGLLAASMSSLSSGINSSCLVLTEDFIGRFRKRQISEQQKVRLAKIMSLLIGIVIIFLSTFVRQVKGNLLEVIYKTVNLLVAPLFVPFFVSLFLGWCRGFATLIGMIASVAIAVTIAFWEEFSGQKGISFIWIIPFSFVGGVFVSMILSLFSSMKKV